MAAPNEEALVAQIEAAFENVQLEDSVSLHLAEFHDSGGSKPRLAILAETDERLDWHRVITPALESFQVTFSFTDLKGFRFYIPAYMIWTVRNHRTSSSIISDFTIYAIDPDHHLFEDTPFVRWFTPSQIAAMDAFLEHCVANSDSVDGDIALENLRKIRSRTCHT